MTYKLIFLSLLFLLTINNISANQSRRLLQTAAPDVPDEPETPFDDPTETEATEGTDDTEGTEGTETDTIDDNGEDNVEDDNQTGDDGDVEDGDEEDNDDDAEFDETDSQNGDLLSPSADDIDSQNDDLLSPSLDDINSAEDIDPCVGLNDESCDSQRDEEGDPLCSFNDNKAECFESVRKDGRFGSGNYDDGYNAAQENALDHHNDLYKIIGILGGLIGILVLIIASGIYWMCRKKSTKTKKGHMELVDPENDEVAMIQK